jgi:hypothetical protein
MSKDGIVNDFVVQTENWSLGKEPYSGLTANKDLKQKENI